MKLKLFQSMFFEIDQNGFIQLLVTKFNSQHNCNTYQNDFTVKCRISTNEFSTVNLLEIFHILPNYTHPTSRIYSSFHKSTILDLRNSGRTKFPKCNVNHYYHILINFVEKWLKRNLKRGQLNNYSSFIELSLINQLYHIMYHMSNTSFTFLRASLANMP